MKLFALWAALCIFAGSSGENVVLTADAPVPVNCGFALVEDAVYFESKAVLWRYSPRW